MDVIDNLHRKARHYLLDNFDFWTKKYQENRAGRTETFEYTYEKSDYDIFPRYQACEAMLQGVEETKLESLTDFENAKNTIVELALRSDTIFTKDNHGTAKNAIENERNKFKKFITELTASELKDVPDLFFRRKLTKEESEIWTEKLTEEFHLDFSGFWYPKEEIKNRKDEFLIFDEDTVTEEKEQELTDLIKPHLEQRFYIINEDNVNYELDSKDFDLFQLSPESYLFDTSLSWIIYYSHEDFYIVKNRKLVDLIKPNFPELINDMNKIITGS